MTNYNKCRLDPSLEKVLSSCIFIRNGLQSLQEDNELPFSVYRNKLEIKNLFFKIKGESTGKLLERTSVTSESL